MSPDIQKLEMIVGMIIMFISILVLTVIIFVKMTGYINTVLWQLFLHLQGMVA